MSQNWLMKRYQSIDEVPELSEGDRRLRVLLLADNKHVANVVQDHINAFKYGSSHKVTVVNPIYEEFKISMYFRRFDVILIHYSIYVLGEYFLPERWRRYIKKFSGLKAQIIQDEYRHVNAMKRRMSDLGIKVIFSSLEVKNLRVVYGDDVHPNAVFFSCLPGYVAKNFFGFNPPLIAERAFDIVYRGRSLPANLGRHAQEKRLIGEQMLEAAEKFSLNVDIAFDEERRIYGSGWPAFLMSGKTTLGVEGGASIFDFDGKIEADVQEYSQHHPNAGFDEIWNHLLISHEGNVTHQTITPKLLEAIATKTVLILYPGYYRGILEPDVHYIELARDGSNMAEVAARIRDDDYLQEMADQTYSDILSRKKISKEWYVAKVDAVLAKRVGST